MAERSRVATPDSEKMAGSDKSGAPPPAPEPESSAAAAGDGRTFSQLLAGAIGAAPPVPAAAPPVPAAAPVLPFPLLICQDSTLIDSPGLLGQLSMTHPAVLATATTQAHARLEAACPSSELLADTSPQHSLSAASSLSLQQRPLQRPEENVCTLAINQPPSSSQKSLSDEPPLSDQKPQSAHSFVKSATSDGYNWRKYGQKQVKNKDHLRSYYRCTKADCLAKKKVEHSPDGRVAEIIYRSLHNHESPQKTRCLRERGAQVHGPVEEDEKLDLSDKQPNESDSSKFTTEQNSCEKPPEHQLAIVGQQLHKSCDCEWDTENKTEVHPGDEKDPKRRLCRSPPSCSASVSKSVRDRKTVVQTTCDAGMVSDGYRWRKYGQKMVKGNPNPRSYYRCTHIGCPVRRHVERASEDAKALVITYEGKHNHDIPSLKRANYPPGSHCSIGTAAVTTDGQVNAPASILDQKCSSESRQDIDRAKTDEKAIELEGDKALESAQALLSIKLNSATTNNNGETSDGTQQLIFKESHAAVTVQNS